MTFQSVLAVNKKEPASLFDFEEMLKKDPEMFQLTVGLLFNFKP